MRTLYKVFILLIVLILPAAAQEQQSTNDIVTKMQHDLNLSDDQVSNISQVVDRYVIASQDLQKSIEDGTINPSAIDSQRQQIKAAETQGISQYLRSDQVYEWNQIQAQEEKNNDTGQDDSLTDTNADTPKNYSSDT